VFQEDCGDEADKVCASRFRNRADGAMYSCENEDEDEDIVIL
jgi:hypothetical protein